MIPELSSTGLPEKSLLREPVRTIPGDAPGAPLSGTALCLSGGGYRAMLFHVGSIWRLFDSGMLAKLDRVSSVSGGSIAAGALALAWAKLMAARPSDREVFEREFVAPIRGLARRTVDCRAVLLGLGVPGWAGRRVAGAYRRHLFGSATLQDLPDAPRFVFNATNMQSGVLWRFSKPYMADYRVGMIRHPKTPLATAVAASSAFPPVLSPLILRLEPRAVEAGKGADLHREPYTSRVVLSDGGVYDNLGLETAWKRHRTMLISDAGGAFSANPRPGGNAISHTMRVLLTIDNQVRSLRKRQLIDGIRERREHDGAYWSIGAEIRDYPARGVLTCDAARTRELAAWPTRLKRVPDVVQERLINWGYAICDAAIRGYVDSSISAPSGFPYSRGV
ncbi:MAG: patatin-like phospholipase family protein [Phycisphaerae bacterium]|nr:MAG: patatin-like phospholipase family protein [Planctomycetota bacterium]KAB2939894.1 MAG: patatin-like phospholipase family protein [Phycisphaerae bacterium]MBE7455145.1 patatin-like phospholipase family protein [Planctomycetia bacterium]MCK6465962.1 patatin-like phospholipase family protein [Phycisphaerae bacterium]MCL4719699.1 patatin-like phospholipase family protein [Phycisphaerae bacterium]